MNGGQDLGGMMGFGPVMPEPNEPVFHADWEKRVLAINVAVGVCGQWNIDMSRHAREKISPRDYLSFSYYRIWLAGLNDLVVRSGMVTGAELENGGKPLTAPIPVKRVLKAADVPATLARGGPSRRESSRAARFAAGDKVRMRNINPASHTRLPRYVRGKLGTVELLQGVHVFPDSAALTGNEDPQWLYTVTFTGPELWGEGADPAIRVSVDAFEPYLDPA